MNSIWITIKKELRSILRDKKSLMMMIATPILIPIYILLFSFVDEKMLNDKLNKEYKVGINYELSSIESDIVSNLNLITEFHDEDELKKLYDDKELSVYVVKDNDTYNVYYNPKNTDSISVYSLVSSYLDGYNSYLGKEYLVSKGISLDKVYSNIKINSYELSGDNDLANILISTGFVFSMMSIFLSATYGATDSTAGEKERGTLETILTFPIRSRDLILGKYLAITISCLITSIISTILVIFSISIAKDSFSLFSSINLNINFMSIIMISIIMISYSFFVSGLCITLTSFAKSYKEAQSTLTPISFITMVPMFLDLLDVKLNTLLSFIPMVSHNMLINSILSDGVGNNLLFIFITVISTFIYSIIVINIIGRMYKSEKVLFSM